MAFYLENLKQYSKRDHQTFFDGFDKCYTLEVYFSGFYWHADFLQTKFLFSNRAALKKLAEVVKRKPIISNSTDRYIF